MRLRHKIAAVCAVVPVLAAVAAVGMLYDITFAGAGPLAAATAGCDVGQVPVNVPGLDPEQTRNVQVIIAEGRRLRVPVFGQEVAVATARQESTLHNLPGGNLDSVGLFQQRASWGTFMQRHTPAWAADAFYKRLLTVPHWQAMPLTVAAQAVQASGTPGAYAAWAALARQAVTGTAASTCDGASTGGTPAGGIVGPTGNVIAGTTTVPAGFVISGTARGTLAVKYALAQLGKPYVWAASGPGSFDCSGLTMAAWASAGVTLPHFTGTQVQQGTAGPTNLTRAVGGDLVFVPGSDGTAANPGHVGMVAGYVDRKDGRHLYIVQAPMTGVPVELTEATEWSGQVSDVRHIA